MKMRINKSSATGFQRKLLIYILQRTIGEILTLIKVSKCIMNSYV